jgi:hypothetical protein
LLKNDVSRRGRRPRLPGLGAELVRNPVELIVLANSPTVIAVRNATSTIPIVMTSVSDPVGFGLVTSLARPGGNVTGVTYSAGLEIFGKQLQLLQEVVPTAKRVAFLWNPSNPGHAAILSNVQTAAKSLGLSSSRPTRCSAATPCASANLRHGTGYRRFMEAGRMSKRVDSSCMEQTS